MIVLLFDRGSFESQTRIKLVKKPFTGKISVSEAQKIDNLTFLKMRMFMLGGVYLIFSV